jgi:hypothetical protein
MSLGLGLNLGLGQRGRRAAETFLLELPGDDLLAFSGDESGLLELSGDFSSAAETFAIFLSGDAATGGTERLRVSGDMQSGTDLKALSGDAL